MNRIKDPKHAALILLIQLLILFILSQFVQQRPGMEPGDAERDILDKQR
jgi:hypothetical protein